MAEKTTKKTNTSKTKKTNTPKVDIKQVEEVLENVDTEIKVDEPEVEQTKTEEIQQLVDVVEQLNESEKNLNDAIEKHPENAVEIIKNEIEKTEGLKKKVEKITKRNITHFWNGMYVD